MPGGPLELEEHSFGLEMRASGTWRTFGRPGFGLAVELGGLGGHSWPLGPCGSQAQGELGDLGEGRGLAGGFEWGGDTWDGDSPGGEGAGWCWANMWEGLWMGWGVRGLESGCMGKGALGWMVAVGRGL